MPGDDTRLIEYLLGTLDPDACAELERELQRSADLRAELAEIADTLSLVAETAPPIQPSAELRERLLESLDHPGQFSGFTQRLCQFFDLGTTRIGEILAHVNAVPGKPWRANTFPGTHLLHFDGGERVATADCGLIYMEPGQAFPAHRHLGDEWVIILQGRIQELGGRRYETGEIVYSKAGSEHAFRAIGDRPLVLAVVLYKGLEFIR